MEAGDTNKLPDILHVGEFVSNIVKPLQLSTCKCCGGAGHRASDKSCPVWVPDDSADLVKMFRGHDSLLSNLCKCLEGCTIKDLGTSFETCKHHYQFKKLKFNDKGVEAYKMLMKEDSFHAKEVLPKDQISEDWQATAKAEMLQSNYLKYSSCTYVRDKLLKSKLILAEATGDSFWGTGLNVTQT